ncbi:MAG: hypothetical protein ABJ084_07825 [Halioglobus sp.]
MSGSVRRVVTGHDDSARAVIRSDETFAPQLIESGDEPCRIVSVLTEAAAYRNKGKALPEVQP